MAQNEIDIKILAKDLASGVIKGVTGAVQGLAKTTASVASSYVDFGKTIATAGSIALGAGVAGLTAVGIAAVKSADELKQNRIAFETMTGSAQQASQLLKDIKKFGLSTPFENKDLVSGAKQLLAYGFSVKQIIPTMKDLGDISAGIGMDKLPVLIRALGQVTAKGKLMGGEFLQIRETGLNLTPVLAKMRGVTEKAFNAKDISAWNISAKEVQIAMNKIATSQFGGLMEKQSKTVSGLLSNLQDFGAGLLNTIGGIDDAGNIIAGGLMDEFSTGLQELFSIIDSNGPAITAFAQNLSKVFGSIVAFGKGLFIAIQNGDAFNDWFGHISDNFPAAQKYVEKFQYALQFVMDFIKNHKDEVVQFFKIFGSIVGFAALLGIITALVNPFTLVLAAIAAISFAVVLLGKLWNENFLGIQDKTTAFLGILQSIWGWIQNFLIPMFILLGQAVVGIIMFLVDTWNRLNLTGIIISGFKLVWDYIVFVLTMIMKSFEIFSLVLQGRWGEAFTKMGEFATTLWEGVKKTFSNAADFIGNVFKGIVGIVKGVINAGIIDPINGAINGLNKVLDEAKKLPGVGGLINNVSQIPRLAQGVNRVPQNMLAMIHKDEAVVPARMNPYNPNASQSGGMGGGVTVIIQGTVNGVDHLVEVVTKAVEEALARKNKLARFNQG